MTVGARSTRADVDDERVLPPGGRSAALVASAAAPCYFGACVRVGGELWWAGQLRLALGLPVRATLGIGDDAKQVDALALGSASIELGWRQALGGRRRSWLAAELGASVPTGSGDAAKLDVERFALAPWRFAPDAATLWLDGALGYGEGGQFAVVRLGLLQELAPTQVTSDGGVKKYATRLRLGLAGGKQLTPAWLFEAGALATAAVAPRADYLLFHDDDNNLLGGAAYQVFAGLRGRGERDDLAVHLRVPFWQARGGGSPRPAAHNQVWIFVEVTGRLWF